ncbi:MAG: hypothetical protein FJ294_02985 [Planctomycetes bacterium]|nr:hypothetical protein [Planctomycetota bacterium]
MRALLFGCLALLGSAPPASAGDVTARLERADIEVRARSAWPAKLNKGWAPLRLELRNCSSEPARVRLDANAPEWQLQRVFERSFELAPGESIETEVLLPAGGQWQQDWNLRLRSQRGDDWNSAGVLSGGCELDYLAILAVSDEVVSASRIAEWGETTSRLKVNPGGYVPPGTTTTPDDAQIALARYDDLPRAWNGYSSLDLVVLDARRELPPEKELESLVAWVRAGGVALIAGPRARELAAERGSLAPWLEERFRVTKDAGDLQTCGLGVLALHTSEQWFDDPDLRESVHRLASEKWDIAPRADGTSRARRTDLAIPGLGAIPHHIFALLLIAFGLLIGPVNFLWIARKGRPVLLLLTIPMIALATTLTLLVYGTLVQGLDVKVASQSIALLDERLHRSACVERRLIYAGLSPGEGLRPEASTALHFLREGSGRFGSVGRNLLRIEQDPDLLLAGDYLPTRIAVQHILQNERAARGRLEVSRSPEGLVVRNGLGARIASVLARDERGAWYASSSAIAEGATATLAPCEPPTRDDLATEPIEIQIGSWARSPEELIPHATYLARIERSPFRDGCGIETTELASDHRLLGIWDLQSEVWK